MRIPEPLFVIVNAFVKLLLSSPLHALMSNSVTVIYYRGRNSGRALSTPVRYQRTERGYRCTTSNQVQWWRNVQAAGNAELLIAGEKFTCTATIADRDPQLTAQALRAFLAAYPQDAVYQDIRLNKDGSLNEADLLAAAKLAVIVDFTPGQPGDSD